MRREWRSWSEHPPQIPHAPIIVRDDAGRQLLSSREPVDVVQAVRNGLGLPSYNYSWLPSGIYREEFWRVTKEWV